MQPFHLGEDPLRVADVVAVARHKRKVALAPAARERMVASRALVVAMLGPGGAPEYGVTSHERLPLARMSVAHTAEEGRVAYGITTGFGELARISIPHTELLDLQRNLLLSHACGMGEPLPEDAVRALLFLRAASLSRGLSGVRPELVDAILALLNSDITPIVPSRGSLGASGDLVPLAHASLVLVGEGEAWLQGRRVPGRAALQAAGLEPMTLQPKEGLALINGTQMMSALVALAVSDGWNLVRNAEIAAAMSLEALLGSVAPFDARIHDARPHVGQRDVAENVRRLLAESGIVESHAGCHRVQDAYSLRCIPQILGPVRDALAHAERILETEFTSATDNPLIFEDGPRSGGNFHGENLGLLCAYLAPALAEVAAVAERRVARLVDPRLSEGLPAFLVSKSGLNSGLMIPQYVAAALVLENQVLVHPAVAGSLPTSANQEDHVSNGAVGALLLTQALRNAERVVGIELLCAAQALDLRAPLAPGVGTRAAHARVRSEIAFLAQDRILAPDLERAAALVRGGEVVSVARAAIGTLH
ncbi:MAG TPA: histidine ammonia-lyase [Candidatus Thermoplasmatota archaeon]|nr:histidine ammonia-lyase [Candidatus Thermoplasmatota archaeon]